MSKKEELKSVFQFIADYLKEDVVIEPKEENEKLLLVEENVPPVDKFKKHIDNLAGDYQHVKALMDKIEVKTKEEAKTKSLLSEQRKEFLEKIKNLKETAIEKAIEFKQEEEVSLSGVTLSKLNNDFSEPKE